MNLEDAENWKRRISTIFPQGGKNGKEHDFLFQFTSQILKVYCQEFSRKSWYRAGYLSQRLPTQMGKPFISGSRVIPLNREVLIVWPALSDTYRVSFRPVIWLPKLSKLTVYEYIGPTPTDSELLQLNLV